MEEGVRQLVERLAALPNFHGPVRLEIHEDPALSDGDETNWKELLRQELEKRRVSVTEESSAALVRIFIAETPTQVVLSASVKVGESDEVRIVALPRDLLPISTVPVSSMRLERQLVYQSADRILDAASFSNGGESGLALLLYRNAELTAVRLDASGTVKQSMSLAVANARASRDPRGELNSRGTDAEVQLSGKSCEFNWSDGGEVKCHPVRIAGQEWRAATMLFSPCDGSGWKLEASGSDWASSDLLRVVPEASSRKESAAVLSQFPGPILSMNGEQNPSSALVVTRNLRTGNNEVYKITLACDN
jgi:hypothetical protein